MLSLGQLYTDDDTNGNNANANNDDTNDDNNDTRWTNHYCIGSLACMPNEPKTTQLSNSTFRSFNLKACFK